MLEDILRQEDHCQSKDAAEPCMIQKDKFPESSRKENGASACRLEYDNPDLGKIFCQLKFQCVYANKLDETLYHKMQ